jgi:hypothetical protein
MTQNLVSNHLGAEQWAQLDGALDSAETALATMLVALDVKERQRKVKMGDGSVAFCRAAIDVIQSNLHLMPRTFDIGEMRRDLASHDALNERIVRLTRLNEKMRQTEMALGSDVMSAALEGYKVLKATGKGQGIEALQRLLGERFEGMGPKKVETPTAG